MHVVEIHSPHTVQTPGAVVASITARKAQRDIEGKVLPVSSFVSSHNETKGPSAIYVVRLLYGTVY